MAFFINYWSFLFSFKSDFKEDESMKEMVLPSTLTEKEMEFVQEIATNMGIKSEIKPFKVCKLF